ncbi:hypothetical protein [Planctomicrobium sp. SH527]|uniref:hypothetical protein n=1 Tax=Planctomicrobium sp. SH527 TaxID=3448123 RepID=UPI003F5C966A
MSLEPVHDVGQYVVSPVGKLIGVIDKERQFDDVVKILNNSGHHEINAYRGEEGIHLLERLHGFYFSDAEELVFQRHVDELKEGHYIVAVHIQWRDAETVADLMASHGARYLVHFGYAAVTWLRS